MLNLWLTVPFMIMLLQLDISDLQSVNGEDTSESSEAEQEGDDFDRTLGTRDVLNMTIVDAKGSFPRQYVWKIVNNRDRRRFVMVSADTEEEMKSWQTSLSNVQTALDKA